MQPSNLTKWGAFLLSVRGVSAGLLLSDILTRHDDPLPMLVGVCGLSISAYLTSLLRVIGWRGLEERIGDAPTGPRPREVERALRTGLDAGVALPEVVRHLHQSRGWEMMLLYSAVKKLSHLTEKEAIRLVFDATNPQAHRSAG